MNRRTAHVVLKAAFEGVGLNGKLATYSLRKSFAHLIAQTHVIDNNVYFSLGTFAFSSVI